ncbi:hypothetical protein K402DRAFT_397017 [Aulographum hederae CBS 113979]|uniref:Chloride channel protein n=1 Tax=Aulographum hederae CBS 113979 TaxID=1176131 RepID=A0A6G1GQK0_9PEZI|nr:hypothetical protein K402DRAFT_397017 [Aulographum hederae CBS 113979]
MSSTHPQPYEPPEAEASSSRNQAAHQPSIEDDISDDDDNILSADPLDNDLSNRISFKRKQKAPTAGFSLPRFLSSPLSSNSRPQSSSPAIRNISESRQSPYANNHAASDSTDAILPYLNGPDAAGPQLDTKDGSTLDWYVEGPGRRVGYDDLTAIDWIYEYSRERKRQRDLPYQGYLRQIWDTAEIWVLLVLTGAASGIIAGFIDVASDWAADLKTGYCSNVNEGGRFYLNKTFCCQHYDEFAKCRDWRTWAESWGVMAKGGSFIINYLIFVLFSVLFAACASYLVKQFAAYAKHSGIPELKTVLGGFVIRRFMGTWTLIIKSLGLCLAVASGLWLGKEGPLVHVACCCANLFMKIPWFRTINDNEARKREVLSAAASAGISVAFGSPIGGVLFSLEQLSYYFPDKTMWQSFVCAMIAAVSLQFFDPFRTGKLVLFQVSYHSGWHSFELLAFVFLGVLGGLYGGLFVKLNMKVAEFRVSSPLIKNSVLQVTAISLLTALINFPITFMRAQASELVYILFAECVDIQEDSLGLCKSGRANTGVVVLLIIAALLGFFLAAITFGLEIPAGILLPSMAIGALYGRAVGLIMEVWQQNHPSFILFRSCEPDVPCITPGTYAIIGAASALGGATRMTVSIVVIMFELTGALTYVLPIMISVLISKWVGDAMGARGIYESWIHFKGYPFLDNRDDNSAEVPDVPAAQVMTRIEDLVVITATGHTIHSLKSLLAAHTFRGFPVIDNAHDAILLGYISRTELDFALSSASKTRDLPAETEAYFSLQPLSDPTTSLDLRPWMDGTPITLNAKASLQLAVSLFQRLGLRYVVFVERGGLRGLLTKKDVWIVLNGEEERRRGDGDAVGGGRGVLRRQEGAEERGLLGAEGEGDEEEERREGLG